MKSFVKYLIFCFVAFTLTSCSTEESENPVFKADAFNLKLEKLDHLENLMELELIETMELDMPSKYKDESAQKNSKRKFREFWKISQNLNDYLENPKSPIEIISISVFKRENEKRGLGLIYTDESKYLRYGLFDITNAELRLREGFPVIVNDVNVTDVLYIGYKYFGDQDIEHIVASSFQTDITISEYNDLYLMQAMDRLLYTKSKLSGSSDKSNSSKAFQFDPYMNEFFDPHMINFLDPGDGGNGCGHSRPGCLNGTSSQQCSVYRGCRDMSCGFMSAKNHYNSDLSLISYKDLFLNNMHSSMLYELEDKFGESALGREYINLYYAMSGHFANTMDFTLMVDIAQNAPVLSSAISDYLSNSSSEIPVSSSLYNELNGIFQYSKVHSSSSTYRNSIELLKVELNSYKNLTVNQVNQQLQPAIIGFN